MKIRNIIFILTLALIMESFTGLSVLAEESVSPEGFQIVAEKGKNKLLFNSEDFTFMLLEKESGRSWSTYVDEETYQKEITSELLRKGLKNLFVIYYSDLDKDSGQLNSTVSDCDKKFDEIDDGIRIDYDFKSVDIALSVLVWIDETGLNIKIPYSSIQEKSRYVLTSISMAPLFGAAAGNDEGYIFYPDGSGALSYFSSIKDPTVLKYKLDLYGDEQVDLEVTKENLRMGIKNNMLPVFGMKVNDTAFIATITEGDSETSLTIDLPGLLYDLHRIYPEFKYRRRYTYTDSQKNNIVVIAKDIIAQDYAVKYIPLIGEDADYSGMANAYRKHLLDNQLISKKIDKSDPMPLGLDLFMGIKEDRMLFDKYIPMTTFSQAETILEEFRDGGVSDILVNLVGYNKDGYGNFTRHLDVSKKLGGIKELQKLNDYTTENNMQLTLQENYIDAPGKARGYSLRTDVVYKENGIIITNSFKDRFLFNPFTALRMLLDNISIFRKHSLNGIAFEKIGSYTYFDFNKNAPATRQVTSDTWGELIRLSKEKLGYASVEGGNLYVLKSADRLYNIPMTDSGYFITDKVIPFYQMVVHGLIPYSCDAGNLFYDSNVQKLKWIEYGAMPYYMLTYEKTENLRNTEFNHLFTSRYIDWIEPALSMYKEFNQNFGSLWSETIIKHEEVDSDLIRVTYSNGTMIYLNYNDETSVFEEISIDALSYKLVERNG